MGIIFISVHICNERRREVNESKIKLCFLLFRNLAMPFFILHCPFSSISFHPMNN